MSYKNVTIWINWCSRRKLNKCINILIKQYINKTSVSKECMLCHYCRFKGVEFKFEPHVYNNVCNATCL